MNTDKNWKSVVLIFGVMGCQLSLWYLFAGYVSKIEAIPYNLRELISPNAPLKSAFMLSLICCLLFGSQVFSVYFFLKINQWKGYFVWGLSCLAIGVGIFIMIYNTVPLESIHDILGSPVFGWPMPWELLYRFTGFVLWPYICFSLAVATVMYFFSVKGNIAFPFSTFSIKCLMCVLFLFYSYNTVITQACTDNLVELMRGGGSWVSFAILSIWMFVLGLAASAFGHSIFKNRSFRSINMLWVIASLITGYILFKFGTAAELQKYGKSFSAMQFLFSPDRENYITGPGLYIRYAIGHLSLFLLIMINQSPFWIIQSMKLTRK